MPPVPVWPCELGCERARRSLTPLPPRGRRHRGRRHRRRHRPPLRINGVTPPPIVFSCRARAVGLLYCLPAAAASTIGCAAARLFSFSAGFFIDKMKFGSIYEEYLRAEQDEYLAKCSHVEYKRLKKVLKQCRVGRSLQADDTNTNQQHEGYDESSELCECNSCTLCDEMFFTQLTKEASEIAGCFSSRVQRLLHLHIPSGLQRYVWCVRQCFIDDQQIMVQKGRMLLNYVTMNAMAIRKILKKYDKIHGSVSGRDFKSKMQTEHIELLQSPWLIELGAFHLNCDGSDINEPVGFLQNGFLKNFSCDLTQPLMTMAISETMKYDYSLTCPICLEYRTLCLTHMHFAVGISFAKVVHVALHLSTSSRVLGLHLQRSSVLYAERLMSSLMLCI